MSDARDPSVRLFGCRSVIVYTHNRPALANFRRQLDIARAIVETTLPYHNPEEDRICFRRGDTTVFSGKSSRLSLSRGGQHACGDFHFSIESRPEDVEEMTQTAAIKLCDEIDRIVTDGERQIRAAISDSNQVLPEIRLVHDLYQAAATAANLSEEDAFILVGLLYPYQAPGVEEFRILTFDGAFTLRSDINKAVKRSVPAGLLLSLDDERGSLTINPIRTSTQMGETTLIDQMRAIKSFNLDPEDLSLIPTDEIAYP